MKSKRNRALLLSLSFAAHGCGGAADLDDPCGTQTTFAATLQGASDVPVYSDAVAPGWNAGWSWSTTLSSDTGLKKTGAASGLVDISASWGGLSFHRDSGPLSLSEVSSLSFDINPGDSVDKVAALSVSLQEGGALGAQLKLGTLSPQPALAPNTWSTVTIPISALRGGLSTLSRVNLQDGAGQGGLRFHVDNIVLGDNTGGGGIDGGGGDNSTFPTRPMTVERNKPFTVNSGTKNWVTVPSAYDGSHRTPITLFVWLHGCGGRSDGDIWTVSPGGSAQTWIALAVGGRENGDPGQDGCWNVDSDPALVLAAIADIKTRFNIKSHGVILGGYSSGGDSSYRTAFYNAHSFAGVLVANTSPFRDTHSSQAASLAAAAWKFNIVHLAHLQDWNYDIASVRRETDAVKAAGFPLVRIEMDGEHWNDPGAWVNGHTVAGTDPDIQKRLFPYLNQGWQSR